MSLTYQDCVNRDYRGKANPGWRGESAGYASKHQYLKRNYGSPKQCEMCWKTGEKEAGGRWNIHYAKKHGREYTHNIEDYMGLCRQCHGKYDLTPEKAERLRSQIKNMTPEQKAKHNVSKSRVAKSKQRDENGRYCQLSKK